MIRSIVLLESKNLLSEEHPRAFSYDYNFMGHPFGPGVMIHLSSEKNCTVLKITNSKMFSGKCFPPYNRCK
ncbi:MAG: hypothetical protein EZS28_017179 [Streblomastix strix]|uniref:Uncharacterized protein n=1 Tax=Streblomastix strix TaxID=222440 RepID=A0A5J4VXG7_9EUKA|nr:MAG: hypothetical protein EZS28_017179 [Streblomastix strix]